MVPSLDDIANHKDSVRFLLYEKHVLSIGLIRCSSYVPDQKPRRTKNFCLVFLIISI